MAACASDRRPGATSAGAARQAGADGEAARRLPACPLCGKPRDTAFRPFCSKRCADIDLNRWLSEVYRAPAAPADDDQE
jgi:hypothetical protein